MQRLLSLEVENFKSYKGKHVIGPFADFTAIVGPNGSGKSNLMDAVSFVLGEDKKNLRVKKLQDLIHGASFGKPVANSCSVTMNCESNSQMRSFMRTISANGSEFCIDSKVVTAQEYSSVLQHLGIFIEAKNFLVYQGQVEQLARHTPEERMQLFEEISRSCEYKAEYEQKKEELIKQEESLVVIFSKRRDIVREKRQAMMEKEEAERYEMMRRQLKSKERDLHLLKLHHLENEISGAVEAANEKKREMQQLTEEKKSCDQALIGMTSEHKKLQRELHAVQIRAVNKANEVNKQKVCYVGAKQKVRHISDKLGTAMEMRNTLQKVADAHKEKIDDLKTKLSEVEKEKAKYKACVDAKSQSLELQLSDSQMNEYNVLKGESIKRCGALNRELHSITEQRDAHQIDLRFQQRLFDEQMERINNKKAAIERSTCDAMHLVEIIDSKKASLEKERDKLGHIEQQVAESKESVENIEAALSVVVEQLADIGGDHEESERERRRNDAMDSLKRIFAGRIYGRLVDLCRPSHQRYRLAVTKVLAPNMMAIVCDTDETARASIAYLKQQRFAPESFLPLSILSTPKISERFRQLTEPQGVKVVFDVVQCLNPDARKAVQFACGNTLLCESADDARKLAFGNGDGEDRQRVVAVDGTLFERSGVISGGGLHLRSRAKKWDESDLRKLRERRAFLVEKKKQLQRAQMMEPNLEMEKTRLYNLAENLKHFQSELNAKNEMVEELQHELEILNKGLAVTQSKIDGIQKIIEENNRRIAELEVTRNGIVDEVFHDFCERLHIRDIRQYEQREIHIIAEVQEQFRKFEAELSRLQNEIDFLNSEDRNLREEQEAENVKQLTNQLEDLKASEDVEEQKLKELEREHGTLKAEFDSKKTAFEESTVRMSALRKGAQQIAHKVKENEKHLVAVEEMIARRRHERRSLLHYCKVSGVELPLINGCLADVDVAELTPSLNANDESSSQPSQSTENQAHHEDEIKINFAFLPERLKKLTDEGQVKEEVKKLSEEVDGTRAAILRLSVPRVNVAERLEALRAKEAGIAEECETARRRVMTAREQFEQVKMARCARFNECFEVVANNIDDLYKRLNHSQSAQAILTADNCEEPYLDGISYSCVVPGKRFRPMDNLSGGEKTLASLALLLAIHSRIPSPFLILDEADAALDGTNIEKVETFLKEYAQKDGQVIMVSLKEVLYKEADIILGVHPASGGESAVLSFDLKRF
uniref:Structural maintenance of chromosomes protein n=1 Tax=Ascaris suum TaxID=6253 RepID=F1KQG1_ASCSU